MTKKVFILVGCKGSGKTHIGSLVSKHMEMHFLRVEPIWLSLKTGENGWEKVESTIDQLLQEHDSVMIESLGLSSGFEKMRTSLSGKYDVKYIRVVADLDTCLQRVSTRDASEHIPVSDDKVLEYNKMAATVELDWSLTIDNNGPASEVDILQAMKRL